MSGSLLSSGLFKYVIKLRESCIKLQERDQLHRIKLSQEAMAKLLHVPLPSRLSHCSDNNTSKVHKVVEQ